jgi:hypothetical protein
MRLLTKYRDNAHNRILSVIALHEKAGRYQGYIAPNDRAKESGPFFSLVRVSCVA